MALARFFSVTLRANTSAQAGAHTDCIGRTGANGVLQTLHLRIANPCLAVFDAPQKLQGAALLCPVQAHFSNVEASIY
jgi:hypothetical protein